MTQDVKTVKIASSADSSDGIITHTESQGEWYVEDFRVLCNGDGTGGNQFSIEAMITPLSGNNSRLLDESTHNDTNASAEYVSNEQIYKFLHIEEYIDFDTEQAIFRVNIDDGATFEVYLHLRRIL